MCLPQYQHSTTRSRAVAKKPRDVGGVLGLKFANIIHDTYWPKLTIVGRAYKDSKELTSGSAGNCRCRQLHCLLMPPFSLDATLMNIRIKLTLIAPAFLLVIMWASSFKNPR